MVFVNGNVRCWHHVRFCTIRSRIAFVVSIHGGLICGGVFSILPGSICNFPNVSDALTNRGLGVASLYAYSSVLFGSTQKGQMGCLGFVIIRIVVFTLFDYRISARVGRLTSLKIFSVRQITNSPRANFNPLLCVGPSFLRIDFDAVPYASSPYLRTIIRCILMRFY
jgi:hypothetical protein